MRKRLIIAVQITCMLLLFASLYLNREQLAQLPQPAFLQTILGSTSTPTDAPAKPPTLTDETIAAYTRAILHADATDLPRLKCPRPDASRYESLKPISSSPPVFSHIQYFFAIDLRQCLSLLPRLLGSIVEVIRFLGPENCALSVVEGNSDDGTNDVLRGLRAEFAALGLKYYFESSDVDPRQGDRIDKLAALRNLALQPIVDGPDAARFREQGAATTTVIFLNDVAACAEDILELVYQRRVLGADMTCAMDWVYVGRDPTFYDVWVARGLNGDSFFDIPSDGNWNSAWNLFWNNQEALQKYQAHQPFQVFSCWNGAVAFTAEPVVQRKVAFRAPQKGECAQGEPQLFCKDMWYHGFGKIAAVPSVNLEYSDDRARDIKTLKGYTSQWTAESGSATIEWQAEPPEKVRCMADYGNQFWEEWTAGLV